MFLSRERYNRRKKAEQYADDSSCSHRQANCRTNGYRASAPLACSRCPVGGVRCTGIDDPCGLRIAKRLQFDGPQSKRVCDH